MSKVFVFFFNLAHVNAVLGEKRIFRLNQPRSRILWGSSQTHGVRSCHYPKWIIDKVIHDVFILAFSVLIQLLGNVECWIHIILLLVSNVDPQEVSLVNLMILSSEWATLYVDKKMSKINCNNPVNVSSILTLSILMTNVFFLWKYTDSAVINVTFKDHEAWNRTRSVHINICMGVLMRVGEPHCDSSVPHKHQRCIGVPPRSSATREIRPRNPRFILPGYCRPPPVIDLKFHMHCHSRQAIAISLLVHSPRVLHTQFFSLLLFALISIASCYWRDTLCCAISCVRNLFASGFGTLSSSRMAEDLGEGGFWERRICLTKKKRRSGFTLWI
jgi:hypothetical protein